MPDQKTEPDWIEGKDLFECIQRFMMAGTVKELFVCEDTLKSYLKKKRGEDMENHFAFALKFIHCHKFHSIRIIDMIEEFKKRESIE